MYTKYRCLTDGKANVNQAVEQGQIVRMQHPDLQIVVVVAKGSVKVLHRLSRIEALLVERIVES